MRRERRRRRFLADKLALVSSCYCVVGVCSIFSFKSLKYDINKQQGNIFFKIWWEK
jgi:hypothetical protein